VGFVAYRSGHDVGKASAEAVNDFRSDRRNVEQLERAVQEANSTVRLALSTIQSMTHTLSQYAGSEVVYELDALVDDIATPGAPEMSPLDAAYAYMNTQSDVGRSFTVPAVHNDWRDDMQWAERDYYKQNESLPAWAVLTAGVSVDEDGTLIFHNAPSSEHWKAWEPR
jgi:hypothetical protein